MSSFRCERCGLIFVREAPAHDTTFCDTCLDRNRRRRDLRGPAFDPRHAPLFRALARERRRASESRFMLGQAADPGWAAT